MVSIKNLEGLIGDFENREPKLEVKVDDYEQAKQLGTLVFHEVNRQSGTNLKNAILNIALQKMGFSGVFEFSYLNL